MGLNFHGKNIIVTGGSKGIGKAIARQLVEDGARVLLVARKLADLKAAQAELQRIAPNAVEIAACDVSNKTQVKKTVSTALKKLGSIDGLINNAGLAIPGYFEEAPLADFEKQMNIDYFGSVYFAKAVVEHLGPGSFITFTSSVVGYMGVFGYTGYAGPKFALLGLAESLQQELDSKDIHVSVLCPPDTDTPGFETEEKSKPYETQRLSESAKLMQAEEVAAIFLKKLKKKKFLITCNFESALFYRLHGIMPGTVRSIMRILVRRAQKQKPA